MAVKKPDYHVQLVADTIQVIEFLAGGDILAWKSLREVMEATGVTKDKSFRILHTLLQCGWVEIGKKGFRQSSKGLMKHLVYAKKHLEEIEGRLGLRQCDQVEKTLRQAKREARQLAPKAGVE